MPDMKTLISEWRVNDDCTGLVLDMLLEQILELNPTLHKLIIETDGDEMTDAESIEFIASYYKI